METFKIVFSGEILPHYNANQVAKRFAAAFNLRDAKAIQHLFSGKVITLKKGLNYKNAQRYRDILIGMGADCCIEREQNIPFQVPYDPLTERRKNASPSFFGNVDASKLSVEPKEDQKNNTSQVTFI